MHTRIIISNFIISNKSIKYFQSRRISFIPPIFSTDRFVQISLKISLIKEILLEHEIFKKRKNRRDSRR